MNRFALLLVLAVSLPFTARADDASHRAKAQELIILLKTDRSVQQIADNILKQASDIGNKTIGNTPSNAQKVQFETFKKQAAEMIDAQVGWKSMQTGTVDIYTNAFSEEELDSIVAFYKSPAGAALLDKTQTINAQIGQLGQSRVAILQPQLVKLFDDFKKSMSAAAPSIPAAPLTAPASPSAPAKSTPK